MATWKVYAERRYSTVVEIDAPTYEEALAQLAEHEPSEVDHDRMDVAGEWEPLTVTSELGEQVWADESMTLHSGDGKVATVPMPMSPLLAFQRENVVEIAAEMGRAIRKAGELLGKAYADAARNLPDLQLPMLPEALAGSAPSSFRPDDHSENCLCRDCRDRNGNRRPSRVQPRD
jgi:hypothetical protein